MLAWMVQGCVKWHSLGKRIPVPERVKVATRQYEAEQDGLSAFLTESCVVRPSEIVPVGAMWDAYEAYYRNYGQSNRERKLTKRQLGDGLKKRDYQSEKQMYGEGMKRTQQRCWLGIGLKPQQDDDEEDAA